MVRFAEEICNFLSTISLLLAMIGHRDRLRSKRNHFASMLEMLPSIVVVELATSYLSLNLSLVLKCCELYPTLYMVQIEIEHKVAGGNLIPPAKIVYTVKRCFISSQEYQLPPISTPSRMGKSNMDSIDEFWESIAFFKISISSSGISSHELS